MKIKRKENEISKKVQKKFKVHLKLDLYNTCEIKEKEM